MAVNPYYLRDQNMWWNPETAFRTNAHGKDTINQAADTYYPFSLVIDDDWSKFRLRKSFTKNKSAGSRFYNNINMEGYEDVRFSISGRVLNHSLLLKYGTNICTNTGAGPSYTHQCDSDDTFPAAPPSFQLLRKIPNGVGAETVYNLFVGCIVEKYTEKVGAKGVVIGEYTIHAALVIAGVSITTEPARSNKTAFNLGHAVLTWTKGGTAYKGIMKGYSLFFSSGAYLFKGAGDFHPAIALMGDLVEFYIDIKFLTFETDTYDDSQDDVSAAQDKDMTLKISRDTTTDYIQYSFEKIFQEMQDNEIEGVLFENFRLRKNPGESGNKWDITEVNSLDATRY